MKDLFERIEASSDTQIVELTLSYLEIYNETIRDLLAPSNGRPLVLREDAENRISVSNLSSYKPQHVHEVMELIVQGNQNRTMSPTEANATSSRSHAVLQINVMQKSRTAELCQEHTFATLSIIDLAGSERASATKNRGERLFEGANINKSLLALGNCINALCDPRRHNHVPYRDSKLTRLLKFSLGGNCKTVMIVCVSPSSQHYDETLNTLKYADRAKKIKTKLVRNQHNLDRHVGSYLKMITEQRAEIESLKNREARVVESAVTAAAQVSNRDRAGCARALKDAMISIRRDFISSASKRAQMVVFHKYSRLLSSILSAALPNEQSCSSCERTRHMINQIDMTVPRFEMPSIPATTLSNLKEMQGWTSHDTDWFNTNVELTWLRANSDAESQVEKQLMLLNQPSESEEAAACSVCSCIGDFLHRILDAKGQELPLLPQTSSEPISDTIPRPRYQRPVHAKRHTVIIRSPVKERRVKRVRWQDDEGDSARSPAISSTPTSPLRDIENETSISDDSPQKPRKFGVRSELKRKSFPAAAGPNKTRAIAKAEKENNPKGDLSPNLRASIGAPARIAVATASSAMKQIDLTAVRQERDKKIWR